MWQTLAEDSGILNLVVIIKRDLTSPLFCSHKKASTSHVSIGKVRIALDLILALTQLTLWPGTYPDPDL